MTDMSEPAAAIAKSIIRCVLDALKRFRSFKVRSGGFEVRFEVMDPIINNEDEDNETDLKRQWRTCRVRQDEENDVNILYVTITDESTTRTCVVLERDQDSESVVEFEQEKKMKAVHCWALDLQADPTAPVLSCNRQITFDSTRAGGRIDPVPESQRVRATSYLGMPTTTTEEVLAMLAALYESWETPLDMSTV